MKLRESLQKLVGLLCSDLTYGAGTGSIIKLSFNSQPMNSVENNINNPDLVGDMELQVYCAWRLIDQDKKCFTWRDVSIRESILNKSINLLIGDRVSEIRYNELTHDVYIRFENGPEFHVLCDIANDDESEENYIFYSDTEILFVDYEGVVQTEQYANH